MELVLTLMNNFKMLWERTPLFVRLTRYGRRASSGWAISPFGTAKLGEPGNQKRLRKNAVIE